MKPESPHISDGELLLFAEDELSPRRTAAFYAHLAICPECKNRLIQTREKLAEITTTYRAARPEISESSSPRALLRARLAEESERYKAAGTPWLHAILNARGLAVACALLLLTVIGFQSLHRLQTRETLGQIEPLPNPQFTPGSTRQANLTDLCATDREEIVKSVPQPIEQQVFREYGLKRVATSDFEVDYLITPGLGGSDDVKNLWPEPHSNTVWNSYVKDQLEDRLHRMVCERKIPLEQAQKDIASNWISAYKKYFQTDQPLASVRPRVPQEIAVFTAGKD